MSTEEERNNVSRGIDAIMEREAQWRADRVAYIMGDTEELQRVFEWASSEGELVETVMSVYRWMFMYDGMIRSNLDCAKQEFRALIERYVDEGEEPCLD